MSIDPGGDRLVVTNAPMYRIVEFAYGFQRSDLIMGEPEWTRTERWDMEAKVAPEDLPAFRARPFAQQREMLIDVLVQRCHLRANVAMKDVPVYALEVAKTGIVLHEVPPTAATAEKQHNWDLTKQRGEIRGREVPIAALLYGLTDAGLGREVVDKTGLKGNYDFDLVWTPDDEAGGSADSIFTAIQEQLGLRLVATRAMVNALTIEHIERPTAD